MKVYLLIDEYLTDTCDTNIIVCKDINSVKRYFFTLLDDIRDNFITQPDSFEFIWSDDEPLSSYIYRHTDLSQLNIYIEEKEILE